jgi:hypothetical protein
MDISYRGFVVWAVGTVIVLGTFLIFVAAGWPGDANGCLWGKDKQSAQGAAAFIPPSAHASAAQKKAYDALTKQVAKDNTCYCEAFSVPDAALGRPGARQPVNTWFNLYAIVSSLIIAFCVYYSRVNGGTKLIESTTWMPDVYIFAALFLGLGSMWFHASMKEWAGMTDTASMYTFMGFLVFFTIRRRWDNAWIFWFGYPLTIATFTIVGEVISAKNTGAPVSEVLIGILVAVYVVFESILWGKAPEGEDCTWSGWWSRWWSHFWWGGSKVSWRWWVAVGCILTAMFFWTYSQTGEFMCTPQSFFQPHGLLWHPLAGLCALFVYFYWKYDAP